ncbi:beta-ketoacyl-ACP synthase 3 [Mollicutes bacterium LVI A0039]|nr:beta-ketoacyl-ACP synthase 3 [Mollicutes bacterium LVI A0039]
MKVIEIKSYVPSSPYTNDDLAKYMDTSNEWIVKRTGIESRNWTEDPIEVMAEKCLSQLVFRDFDAIIVTTMSTINSAPSLSGVCAKYLGINDCMCIDLNAACTGFVYGAQVAEGLLKSGFKNVLLLSIEKMSSIIDLTDRSTAILFGDGACATVLSHGGNDLRFKYNYTTHENEALIKNQGEYLKMEGQTVFKFATTTISNALAAYGDLSDIDYFVFHQANKRIIDNVTRKFKIDRDKVIINIEKIANTSSASIPIALSDLVLKPGEKVMMVGFGAGLSTGCIVYEH